MANSSTCETANEMTGAEDVLRLSIPPQAHQSRVVRRGVARFAHERGVGDDDLALFLTALGEALANAIEHARAEAEIEVAVALAADRIVGKVRDRGLGFPRDAGAGEAEPDPASERGRGLPIMRGCSDIFCVRSVPGGGTSVVMGRFLRSTQRNSGGT